MSQRFARLKRAPIDEASGASEVPDNGMCLSVFLVLESPTRPGAVLAGKVDPSAPWWEIGAVDPRRLAAIGERWMLPSRQLRLFESPDDAARSILAEQLGSGPLSLDRPFVFSDPSERPGGPGRDPHWDIHLVYRGRWPASAAPKFSAWKQLEFLDVANTGRAEFARNQGDVLALVGLVPRD